MNITQILDEEAKLARFHEATNFGQRNGEEFPAVARAALESKEMRSLISMAVLTMLLQLATRNGAELRTMMADRERVAKRDEFNRPLLDALWLGYRLGRRQQLEEDQVVEKIAKEGR